MCASETTGRYQLRVPGSTISQALLRALKAGTTGTVTDDGRVDLGLDTTDSILPPQDDLPLKPGTTVYVDLGHGNFPRCEPVAARERRQERQRQEREQNEQERAAELDRKREQAEQFWARHDLPFAADTAIKGRRSGLLRGSDGSGTDRRTVVHCWVETAFSAGRLSRPAETYLCDPNGPNASHVFTEHRHRDGSGGSYRPIVTCQQCRDLMERWEQPPGEADA